MTIFKLFEIEICLLDSLFQVEGKFEASFNICPVMSPDHLRDTVVQ